MRKYFKDDYDFRRVGIIQLYKNGTCDLITRGSDIRDIMSDPYLEFSKRITLNELGFYVSVLKIDDSHKGKYNSLKECVNELKNKVKGKNAIDIRKSLTSNDSKKGHKKMKRDSQPINEYNNLVESTAEWLNDNIDDFADSQEALDEAIRGAVEYFDDAWIVLKNNFYDTPHEVNYDEAIEQFADDVIQELKTIYDKEI